jgi:hypothetical protein
MFQNFCSDDGTDWSRVSPKASLSSTTVTITPPPHVPALCLSRINGAGDHELGHGQLGGHEEGGERRGGGGGGGGGAGGKGGRAVGG